MMDMHAAVGSGSSLPLPSRPLFPPVLYPCRLPQVTRAFYCSVFPKIFFFVFFDLLGKKHTAVHDDKVVVAPIFMAVHPHQYVPM